MNEQNIYSKVQEHYGTTAQGGNDSSYGRTVAQAFGYNPEELETIPQDSNLGLSCGNPLALVNVKEGETVCDLGSGAGIDVFLASKKVGSNGKVIGIDMNKDMLTRANRIKEASGISNVSFVESPITKITLSSATVDCIISNCVINLVPDADKAMVFNEMARLLRPGGRVAISDILAKHALPAEIKSNMDLYVGCIAGASQVAEYEKYLNEAGFEDVLIVDSHSDLNIYKQGSANGSNGCCGGGKKQSSASYEANDIDFNEYAGSFKIYAVKR